MAKSKALISYAFIAQMICGFVFEHATSRIGYAALLYLGPPWVFHIIILMTRFISNRTLYILNWFKFSKRESSGDTVQSPTSYSFLKVKLVYPPQWPFHGGSSVVVLCCLILVEFQ